MDLSIAGIQFLKLHSCRRAITIENAWLVAAASQYILQTVQPPREYADFAAADCDEEDAALCTWRPTHCLDVFIYVSPEQGESFLGVLMHGPTPSVEYYRSEDQISVASGRGVVFGHLTCDSSKSGMAAASQLNILVYDGIPLHSHNRKMPVRERYAWVQSIAQDLQQNTVGHARIMVQWMGCPSTHEKIHTMPLPHSKCGISLVNTNRTYVMYRFTDTPSTFQ